MINRQQVAVGGAIFNDKGELLFVRRIANDEFMPGVWEIPGGGTEYGEKPEDGLKREIMEECGIEIEVGKPVVVSDYYIERNGERVQRVEITFLCELRSDTNHVTLSEEHDAFTWKNIKELTNLEMTEYMINIMDSVVEAKLNKF
jgi:mutator protein MutT